MDEKKHILEDAAATYSLKQDSTRTLSAKGMTVEEAYDLVCKDLKGIYGLSDADLEKNVHDAFFAIYEIEKTLPRRQPSQKRWQGCFMTNTARWYYCYRIEGNDIIVTDACHAQNMKTPIDSIHQ